VPARYIHTCYRILDPERTIDFYVNKLGMKKVGEMHFDTATNYFFAMEEDADALMLELTHNHDRTEPYDPGTGYSHVAFTVDDLEGTVAKLEEHHVGRIAVACTHGLFSGKAIDRLKANDRIAEIVTTNTVPISPEKRLPTM